MKAIKLILIGLFVMILSSCAGLPKAPAIPVPGPYLPAPIPTQIPRQEIIHVVAPGETLWRISKIYDVNIDTIMQANRLREKDQLAMGTKLVVPNALPARSIIPLYPSNKWKFIIIHHSATDEGNALTFYNSHKNRGFIDGLGYHFVIDNGSSGKANGYIEISPRWIKQQPGAHCKADSMNYKGIGICLVGNFSRENVSEKQLVSLVYLVNSLRAYYNIPLQNVMGHGQVQGAQTECPGKKFPWKEFFSQLK